MTSLSRTKRPTTPHGRITPARTAASLLALLLVWSPASRAQAPSNRNESVSYARDAYGTLPAAASPVKTMFYYRAPLTNTSAPPAFTPHHGGQPLPSGPPVATAQNGGGGHLVGQREKAESSPGGPYSTRKKPSDEELDFIVRIDLPGPDLLFRRESENAVFERLRQESRHRTGASRIVFPEEERLTKEKFMPRNFPLMVEVVEPSYVCHRRLIFEQRNFERQGWDLGILTPAVCLAGFYGDLITLPYQCGTRPFQQYECSAGKCLPGDPTPLLLYPPELSITGLAFQAAAVASGFYFFP